MLRYISILLTLYIGLSLCNMAVAGTHYSKPQYAVLKALDIKNRTLAVRNDIYKLRVGVKIHDSGNKLPRLSSLTVGHEIKFQTRKNKRTGQVEISEIWIQHM